MCRIMLLLWVYRQNKMLIVLLNAANAFQLINLLFTNFAMQNFYTI